MITERQAMAAMVALSVGGLKPPDAHAMPADPETGSPPGRVLAARVYAAALNSMGLTPAELEQAVIDYIAEPQEGQYPKCWPSPGHLVARTGIARTAAQLGSTDESEAAWTHMHRRMAAVGFSPDRDVPARNLHSDPAKNDALFVALERFGGAERWRQMPKEDTNPIGHHAAKKAWTACFVAARKAQGNNPTTVRQMVESTRKMIEAHRD